MSVSNWIGARSLSREGELLLLPQITSCSARPPTSSSFIIGSQGHRDIVQPPPQIPIHYS